MDVAGLTERVQALFPVKFEDSLMHDDDQNTPTNLIRQAYELALSKYEKIESKEFSANTDLPNVVSILKWVPASYVNDANRYTQAVWDSLGKVVRPDKIKVYFTPARRLLIRPEGTAVHVEYVVDPDSLTIEDLNSTYIQWCIKYAVALLKEKEGYLGTMAKLDALSIETNYAEMRSEGQTERDLLEERLDEMYSGTLAIRTN